jgi:DNA-binding transcriptional ArsR family regulator
MSKGLGHIEHEVLRLLPQAPRGHADSLTLAALIYRVKLPEECYRNFPGTFYLHDDVSSAQRSAVRRALASLKRKGLVEETGRWQRGRRYWKIAGTESSAELLQRALTGPDALERPLTKPPSA